MKEDKIQTGLRLPQSQYEKLRELAASSGASVNSIILLLVEIGLQAVNLGIEVEARSSPHIPTGSTEGCTPQDC